MTGKEYLSQIKKFERLIENKKKELQYLKELSTTISSPRLGDKVQTSQKKDNIIDSICRISEAESQFNELIDKYIDVKTTALEWLMADCKPNVFDVMYKRYMEYKNFSEISDELNISMSHIYKLHNMGIKIIENNIKR